jgi:hypothetical protein
VRRPLAKRCGPMLHVLDRTEKFLSSISDVAGWCFCVARYQRGSIKHGETHRCPVALVRERSNFRVAIELLRAATLEDGQTSRDEFVMALKMRDKRHVTGRGATVSHDYYLGEKR